MTIEKKKKGVKMMNRFVVEDSLRKDGGAIGEKKHSRTVDSEERG